MTKRISLILLITILLFALAACSAQSEPQDPTDPNTISTIAMQTVQALMTEQAFSTLAANATEVAGQPTLTLPPDSTSVAQEPTPTPIINTPTPQMTNTPQNTPTLSALDKVSFVKDVTIPDGTQIDSGEKFTKTWQLKNSGTTTWTTSYDLVFVSGNAMSGAASVDLTKEVKPGETIDISVELTAPTKPGAYEGYWKMRNASGHTFGAGNDASQSFWVKINVAEYVSDVVPSVKYDYDLTAKICTANWTSSLGTVAYPCDHDEYMSEVWVSVDGDPTFENGYHDDERTILMHLDGEKNSWVQGFYPEFEVEDGHKFHTIVGCIKDNDECDVVVSLDVKIDGSTENIGKWTETYDKKVSSINIDLSKYKGKKVQFILGISNRSDTESTIFWLAPRVVK